MKHLARLSHLAFALATAFATAQTNLSQYVQHVVVVIQENRTPDNLFNQDAGLVANGAHVQPTNNTGPCHSVSLPDPQIPLQATPPLDLLGSRTQP